MKLYVTIFCSLILGWNCLVFGYKIKNGPLLTKRPEWLKICRRADPDLNHCLNDLFTGMFPYLAAGIPEMNIDPFEPLPLDKVTISKGAGAITLTGSLYNLTVTGPSNATASYTNLDIPNKKWNFGLDLPLLSIKSQYNLKGRILVLPLIGHGNCDLKLTNVRTHVKTKVQFPKIEGREILEIENMHVAFTVEKMRVKFYNLFQGNKILGQTLNAFINSHALEIIQELEESIGQSLAEIFTDIINNIYTKMPTDLWLLSDEEFRMAEKRL